MAKKIYFDNARKSMKEAKKIFGIAVQEVFKDFPLAVGDIVLYVNMCDWCLPSRILVNDEGNVIIEGTDGGVPIEVEIGADGFLRLFDAEDGEFIRD